MRIFNHNGTPLPATIPTYKELDPDIGEFDRQEDPPQLWARAQAHMEEAERIVEWVHKSPAPNYEQMAVNIFTESRKAKQYVNGITETISRVKIDGLILTGERWLKLRKAELATFTERAAAVEAIGEYAIGKRLIEIRRRAMNKILENRDEWISFEWVGTIFGKVSELAKAAHPFTHIDAFYEKVKDDLRSLRPDVGEFARAYVIMATIGGGIAATVAAAYAYRTFLK